jgi:hypothetical protein
MSLLMSEPESESVFESKEGCGLGDADDNDGRDEDVREERLGEEVLEAAGVPVGMWQGVTKTCGVCVRYVCYKIPLHVLR